MEIMTLMTQLTSYAHSWCDIFINRFVYNWFIKDSYMMESIFLKIIFSNLGNRKKKLFFF